jgi:ankyrin repeat protein
MVFFKVVFLSVLKFIHFHSMRELERTFTCQACRFFRTASIILFILFEAGGLGHSHFTFQYVVSTKIYACDHTHFACTRHRLQRKPAHCPSSLIILRGGEADDLDSVDSNISSVAEDENEWDYGKFGMKPPPTAEELSLNPQYTGKKGELDYLIKDNNIGRWGWTALHRAAIEGDAEALGKMIGMGGDVNAATQNGWTPLHEAASWGKCDIAQLLIANGANASATNKNGWTALHFAAATGHTPTVELLIASGVDRNHRDNYGDTALDKALRNSKAR